MCVHVVSVEAFHGIPCLDFGKQRSLRALWIDLGLQDVEGVQMGARWKRTGCRLRIGSLNGGGETVGGGICRVLCHAGFGGDKRGARGTGVPAPLCAGGFAGQQKRLVVAPVASRIISAAGQTV